MLGFSGFVGIFCIFWNFVISRKEKLQSAIDFISQPEQQKDLILLDLLGSSDISMKQFSEALSIFEDNSGSNELLNNVLNPHPIAARLMGDRIERLCLEYVQYTKHFDEGAETLFPDIDSNPKYRAYYEEFRPEIDAVAPVHPPFNTAMEDIFQLKLDRLAREFFKFRY